MAACWALVTPGYRLLKTSSAVHGKVETMTLKTSWVRARPEVVRYIKLLFLIMAGGAIYPLLYLRQNFELTLLSTFGISLAELSVAYSILGMAFVFSYVPSGWLADRFSPRVFFLKTCEEPRGGAELSAAERLDFGAATARHGFSIRWTWTP